MSWYQLIAAKRSVMKKGHIYGMAGEKVHLISEYNGVLIVQGKTEAFSILADEAIQCASPKDKVKTTN